MNDLQIGDIIRDNDPRVTNRRLMVMAMGDMVSASPMGSVYGNRPLVRIQRKRIYTDDKPRRSGFSVVRG